MLSREDNELLTRTGPGTAMGDLIRRYWIPVVESRRARAGGTREARDAARRAPHRLPRPQRAHRPHRRVLPASRRLALLRAGRGERHALRLPRLEVRPGRPVRGDAERAARVELRDQGRPHRVSVRGEGRGRLGLHGAGRRAARRCPSSSSRCCPRGTRLHLAARAGLQLVPGDGGRHRLEPHLVPPRADRSPRQRGHRGHGPGQLRGGRGGLDGRPRAALRGGRHRLRRGDRGAPGEPRRPVVLAHHPVPAAVLHDAARPIWTSASCSRTSGCRWTTRTR